MEYALAIVLGVVAASLGAVAVWEHMRRWCENDEEGDDRAV